MHLLSLTLNKDIANLYYAFKQHNYEKKIAPTMSNQLPDQQNNVSLLTTLT